MPHMLFRAADAAITPFSRQLPAAAPMFTLLRAPRVFRHAFAAVDMLLPPYTLIYVERLLWQLRAIIFALRYADAAYAMPDAFFHALLLITLCYC